MTGHIYKFKYKSEFLSFLDFGHFKKTESNNYCFIARCFEKNKDKHTITRLLLEMMHYVCNLQISQFSIGWHEVLLPINHSFNKICDIIGYFLNQNTRNSKFCFASSEKKAI